MKKIYMLFAAMAFVGFGVLNAQTVLIDTDFSDLTPTPANDANKSSQGPYNTPKGEITWHGTKYNDLKNFPAIGETVDDKIDPAADGNSNVRFLRTGSSFTLTDGVPTNHFFQVTPNDDFVNGGKVTLLVSVNGTAKGINVYDASAAEYLGTIDISEIALYQKVPVEFILPADFSGKKTLSFTRAELDGSVGGVTFFTWNIKIETAFSQEPQEPQEPQSMDWNISSDDFNALGKFEETKTVAGLTLYAAAGKALEVDENEKSLDDVDYTHRLKLGGTGTFDEEGLPLNRVVAFEVEGNISIKILTLSSSGSEDRTLNVSAGTKDNIIGTVDAFGSPLTASIVDYTGEATTILLWSNSGGVNIYRIIVGAAGDPSVSVKPVLENANVVGLEYYNISGVNMGGNWDQLPSGIYIKVAKFDNGTVDTKKVIKK